MIQSRAGCYWERLVRYLGPGNENSTLVASVYKTRGPAMISAKEKDTCRLHRLLAKCDSREGLGTLSSATAAPVK